MTDWKKWGRGLLGAAINTAVTSVSLVAIDPVAFNLHDGLLKLGKAAVVSGLIGAILYLKQHPTPWYEQLIGGSK